jgi:hypothetical protein
LTFDRDHHFHPQTAITINHPDQYDDQGHTSKQLPMTAITPSNFHDDHGHRQNQQGVQKVKSANFYDDHGHRENQ